MSSKYRLLPVTQQQATKTRLFTIKFNSDFQQQLLKHVAQTKGPTSIKLIVKDGLATIKITESSPTAYRLQSAPESSKVDIYKKFSNSTYKNIGTINSKFVTTSTVSSPTITNDVPNSTTTTTTTTTTSTNSSSKKTSSPPSRMQQVIKKALNPLSYGPIKAEDLTGRFKLNEDELSYILTKIAMQYDPVHQVIKEYPITKNIDKADKSKYYVLNYTSYKDLTFDKKMMPEEFDKLKANCLLAFDHLKYPQNHPAREALSSKSPTLPSNKRSTSSSSTSSSTTFSSKVTLKYSNGSKSNGSTNGSKSNSSKSNGSKSNTPKPQKRKLESPLTENSSSSTSHSNKPVSSGKQAPSIGKRSNSSSSSSSIKSNSTFSSSTSTSTSNSSNSSDSPNSSNSSDVNTEQSEKRRKLSDESEDYFTNLAIKFKSKYKEYEKLYKSINSAQKKDAEQVKRLYEMHKNLENWKEQLWNSVEQA